MTSFRPDASVATIRVSIIGMLRNYFEVPVSPDVLFDKVKKDVQAFHRRMVVRADFDLALEQLIMLQGIEVNEEYGISIPS